MSANAPQAHHPATGGSGRHYTLYLVSSRPAESVEPPSRPIGWIEALLIVALVVVSLAALAGGAFLWMRGVPATDRYGTLTGRVEPRGHGTTHLTALDAGATVVVTQENVAKPVAVARVDARGRFHLHLRPGVYTLHLQSHDPKLTARARTVHVLGGQVLQPTLRAGAPVTAASVSGK